MRDLVFMSLEPWNEVWRRNQYFAAGLLQQGHVNRILFVEPAADPAYGLMRGHRPTTGSGCREITEIEGISEGQLFGFQPTKYLPRRVDRRADERLAKATIRVARRLAMNSPLLWINDPTGVEVLKQTGWPSIYDVTDDWLLADRSPAEHDRLVQQEGTLLERCNEVIVCSPDLRRRKGESRKVHLIPNAVDLKGYEAERPRPTDLPTGPVALYVGTLHRDRLDVPLTERLGRTLEPNGKLVLVGPNALDGRDTERLYAAGVVILGQKPRDEVPAYLRHADLLVVPHVVTPFTESLDPIKAYEYAAARRPVVSTAVAGFRDQDGVTVRNADDFPSEVLLQVVPRRADVHQTTAPDWSLRVEQVAQVLNRLG